MERSKKEQAISAASERKPAGPLWARNLRDLIVIVGFIAGFSTISAFAVPYLPRGAWSVAVAVGSAILWIIILCLARKKEPIQPPQTTTGSSAPDRV